MRGSGRVPEPDRRFLVAPMAMALVLSFFVESGALWALLLLIPSQAIGSRVSHRQSG